MSIRTANSKDDLRKLGYMAASFAKESKFVEVDPDRPEYSYWPLLESGTAVVFMLEEEGKLIGGLGAIEFPDLHSGKLMAVETFWYILPEHRGKGLSLIQAYEQWAKNNNCVYCAMIHMVDSHPEVLEKLYLRKGYKLVEKHYVKEILP